MMRIYGIDDKSLKEGKVWVRIRGTNPTIQRQVSEIAYDDTLEAVVFRYAEEHSRRIVHMANLDILIRD